MLYIPNPLYDLHKYFGFLLNFSISWKSCEKEQWPKKYFFSSIFLTYCQDLLVQVNKRVEYIWVHKIMTNDWVCKGPTNLNMFSLFGEQIKSLSSYQSKLSFGNQIHPNFAFLGRLLTQTATLQKNHIFLHQMSKQFWQLWLTHFFWDQV